jgi:signal transduction histidine kinase/type II secretory pathway predicted ATPase ExeA
MRDAMNALRQQGTHHTSYQSLAEIKSDKEARFFTSLYTGIEMDVLPIHTTASQTLPESAFEFQQALLNLIHHSDRNLAIFLDDLEIPPPNLIADLLGALRALFTLVVDQPGAHFQAVVCGSLSLRQVALHSASRFESVSDLVFVDDLDETERMDLVNKLLKDSGMIPTTKGIQTFLDLTSGDPLLIESLAKLCLQQMKEAGKTRVTPARVKEATELLVKLLPEQKVVTQFQQIENNPDLLSSTLKILEQGEVSSSDLHIELSETPTLLDLCGVLRRTGYKYQVKCELWSRLLKNLLTEERVGRHYAIAGEWQKAFRFFGNAIAKGHCEIILEVFAYTISAIYASQSVLEAFGHLALGLIATFPDSSIQLYYSIEDHLEMVYPLESGRERQRIRLNDSHLPEIKALNGPDYSITNTPSGQGFLIPLRGGDVEAPPIGLLSFIKHRPHDSPHQTREELVHIIGFLHQAAQTIEIKIRLFSINHKAELQEQRARITSGLIHDIYSAVANIPDLVDELEKQLVEGKEVETPLKDLRKQAYETDRVSKKLKDFVISGKFEPKFVKVEALVEDTLKNFQENGSNIRMIYTKKGLSREIWADEMALGLLVKNLIVNALEAIPQEREGQILIRADQAHEYLILTISDNGEGIPPENIPKLFDFGFSSKKGNKMRGIGLYLCLQIAEVHHGKLSVESEPGVGTTFTLSLPNLTPPSE